MWRFSVLLGNRGVWVLVVVTNHCVSLKRVSYVELSLVVIQLDSLIVCWFKQFTCFFSSSLIPTLSWLPNHVLQSSSSLNPPSCMWLLANALCLRWCNFFHRNKLVIKWSCLLLSPGANWSVSTYSTVHSHLFLFPTHRGLLWLLSTRSNTRPPPQIGRLVGQVSADLLLLLADHSDTLLDLYPEIPPRIIQVSTEFGMGICERCNQCEQGKSMALERQTLLGTRRREQIWKPVEDVRSSTRAQLVTKKKVGP